MKAFPEGNAIVYCEGLFGTPNGKTAHGLVRFTKRYNVLSVIDSTHAGQDSGMVLNGIPNGIPIFGSVAEAVAAGIEKGTPATHFVIGLAPDGGRLPAQGREDVRTAIKLGLNIDSGLHDFISEDRLLSSLAKEKGVKIRDIRKAPPRSKQHFYTGKISEVKALKIAVLGTDSAVGKRTTAWMIVDALTKTGYKAEMVGTGQTAWMQGVRFGIMLDSIINDFLTGEIEHAVWSAWDYSHPDVIVIEGQGSLLNPAYPGGYELLAAAQPDCVILQHAPTRTHYDGFPQFIIQPLSKQIQAIEVVSGKPVVAITINHENIPPGQVSLVCSQISESTGLPAVDVLLDGADRVVKTLLPYLKQKMAVSIA
jgi:uncharacterized NAD-dependent epimerase/dehydratase family protein